MLALTCRRSVPLRKRSPAAQNSVVGDGSITASIKPAEAKSSQAVRKTAKPIMLRKIFPLACQTASGARLIADNAV
jgi:hypothetical protein